MKSADDIRREIDGILTLGADHAKETDEEAASRLARLSPAAYDRVREKEAARLDVRVATLDRLVKKARSQVEEDAPVGQGSPLNLREPDPWPEPVKGAELLDGLAAAIGDHVVMAPETCRAVALWTVFAHALDRFDFAPRLLVKSPEKRCGKSTLLDALTELCPRALPASNITAAAVFRTIEKARPALLLDEADSFIRENEELRGIINSGYRRSLAFTIRNVEVNGEHEPRKFSTWCAMAIAGIGSQHGTIEDRSIIVELRRKLPSEPVERLDDKARFRLAELARKAARWTADHAERLAAADPETPSELHDRAADNWRPLLAIADAAGGEWPKLARAAARTLCGGSEKSTARVLLLEDLRELYAARGHPDWIATTTLLEELAKLEERPWSEWSKGRPITSQALRSLLEGFSVYSTRDTKQTARGYRREAFREAWERYLSPAQTDQSVHPSAPPADQSVYPSRTRGNAGFSPDNDPSMAPVGLTDRDSPKSQQTCGFQADRRIENPDDGGARTDGRIEAPERSPARPANGHARPAWDDARGWTARFRGGIEARRAVLVEWATAAGGGVEDGALLLPAGLKQGLALAELKNKAGQLGLRCEVRP